MFTMNQQAYRLFLKSLLNGVSKKRVIQGTYLMKYYFMQTSQCDVKFTPFPQENKNR